MNIFILYFFMWFITLIQKLYSIQYDSSSVSQFKNNNQNKIKINDWFCVLLNESVIALLIYGKRKKKGERFLYTNIIWLGKSYHLMLLVDSERYQCPVQYHYFIFSCEILTIIKMSCDTITSLPLVWYWS